MLRICIQIINHGVMMSQQFQQSMYRSITFVTLTKTNKKLTNILCRKEEMVLRSFPKTNYCPIFKTKGNKNTGNHHQGVLYRYLFSYFLRYPCKCWSYQKLVAIWIEMRRCAVLSIVTTMYSNFCSRSYDVTKISTINPSIWWYIDLGK